MPKAATTATKKSAAKTTATKATVKTASKATKAAPVKKAAAAVKKAAPAKKAAAAPAKKAAAAVKKAAPVKKAAAPIKKAAAPVKKAAATKAAPAKKAAAPVKKVAQKAVVPVKKAAEKVTAAKKTAVKKTETTPVESVVKKTETAPKVKASTPAPPAAPAKPAKPVLVIKPMSQAAIAKDPFLSSQRELLLAERAEYVQQADSLRAEAEQMAADAEPGDTQFDEESGEGTTAAVDREHNLRLVQNAVATIDEIDRAIEKMSKGIYGLCEHCGEEIAKPRLEALPYASLCVACKSGGLTRR